ncbi:MAG: glucosyltransferase domain-containing protein [Lachnospiraceae bacterium]|nr:glucosyltransferase domain-containing protein [Lachnospiraceae bacterium]
MDALFGRLWTTVKKKEYAVPFWSAVIVGLLTHMFLFTNKLPNADAMTSFYFDQNMVTSGRWFLTVVCGISSYYDLNWIIGILSVFYLAIAAVFISEFFEVKTLSARGCIGALLVTFPALTATFAYLYTADGYMLAFLLAVLAAYFTKKYKWGFIGGAVCLACSIGSYQAYLAVTVLLCLFSLIGMCLENKPFKELWSRAWRYLVMGLGGGVLYYVALKVCLSVQGKELDTYQGINEMGKISLQTLPGMIYDAYFDFAAFALKGNIFINNGFSLVCVVLLTVVVCATALFCYLKSKAFKRWYQTLLLLVFTAMIPLGTNIIFFMSSDVNFHLLMRMQWVLFPIYAVVLSEAWPVKTDGGDSTNKERKKVSLALVVACIGVLASGGLSYQFALMDNIAYFNMNERYEKTYAYCLRLVDRMEQTEGYVQGMPVAMIGVVDESKYPITDITGDVTSRISGSTGDILIYKGEQYAAFMKHYMNVTINPVVGDQIIEIYNSPEYREMDSFPAENSMKVVDGVLYIKTEPKE